MTNRDIRAEILEGLLAINEFKKIEHRQSSGCLANIDGNEIMQTRMIILEGVEHGETSILEGRTFTNAQAKEKMSKWLK